MGIFSRFPYTDFHRLNADWILEKVKEAAASVAEALGLVQQSAQDAAEAAETVEGYDTRITDVELATEGLADLIDLVSGVANNCVRFDSAQGLSGAQQTQARSNIAAASAAGLTALSDEVWAQGSSITTLQAGAVQADRVQAFSDAQKTRARTNIGAAEAGVVPSGVVRYDQAQSLTTEQKTQARTNIGAAEAGMVPSGVVRYDQAQALSTSEQQRARYNINAASSDVAPYPQSTDEDSILTAANDGTASWEPAKWVRYDVVQPLSDNQKSLARSNIGAAAEVFNVVFTFSSFDRTLWQPVFTCDKTYNEIVAAINENRNIVFRLDTRNADTMWTGIMVTKDFIATTGTGGTISEIMVNFEISNALDVNDQCFWIQIGYTASMGVTTIGYSYI